MHTYQKSKLKMESTQIDVQKLSTKWGMLVASHDPTTGEYKGMARDALTILYVKKSLARTICNKANYTFCKII